MTSIAVLQARTNSSRLPAKVLLPIGGMPLVILAARRAANTGRNVIVATSTEVADDALANLITDAGISCYRGSLANTLDRFVGALDGYDSNTLVFRLTADNVFPDGSLMDEMEEEFVRCGLKYLCCNGEKSGLPYGMSVELTRLCFLREAALTTKSQYEQEHVTPFITRVYGATYFQRYMHLNKGHLRCTVDNLDDYLAIQYVFSDIAAPDQISSFELIDRLPKAPYQPQQLMPTRKLVLGTAQLGMTYGIANQTGKPDQAISEKLIKTVIANGTSFLDTARAYGNSEEVIGNVLKSGWEGRAQVITKLSPMSDCPVDATLTTVNAVVDASIYRSCSALNLRKLDVLMLHRASHLSDWSGAVWNRLIEHKANGMFKALGVSVQSPAELEEALATRDVEFIQMPYNVLDWRWDALIPKIRETKKRRQLHIHARSALLQGLLLCSTYENWHNANVVNPEQVIKWLAAQCVDTASNSEADFCLRFVKSLDWIDGVVVGMETLEQLTQNIRVFCSYDFSVQQMHNILNSRPMLSEQTLNPSCWKTKI